MPGNPREHVNYIMNYAGTPTRDNYITKSRSSSFIVLYMQFIYLPFALLRL